MTPPPAIPAATLILLREFPDQPPQVLMVERSPAMTFAPGAAVFPGGRVDPADVDLAASILPKLDPGDGAARIAAIRETLEETGLAIGLHPPPSAAHAAAIRRRLAAGASVGAALPAGTRLQPGALIPFARWRPAHDAVRKFDARFYLAACPAMLGEAIVDGTENTRADWTTPAALLAAADTGAARLILPTRRTPERLAASASFAEGAADAAHYPIRTIVPWTEQRGGRAVVCIPDDLGYPITAEPLAEAVRG